MTVQDKNDLLLLLLRRGMFGSSENVADIFGDCRPSGEDWQDIYAEAVSQTVTGLALEGTVDLADAALPSELFDRWQSQSLSQMLKSEDLLTLQDRVIAVLQDKGIVGAVLKGSAAAFCYRLPTARLSGDIDYFVDEETYAAAIAALEADGFSRAKDETNVIHTELSFHGMTVELHRRINGLPEGHGGEEIHKRMRRALSEGRTAVVDGHTFPVLDDVSQALILLLHTQHHMQIGGLGLRHLCDWAAFVDKKLNRELLEELKPILTEVGLWKFTKALTATCVRYLFPPETSFPLCGDVSLDLCRAILDDFFLCGNFGRKTPELTKGSDLLTRTVVKEDGTHTESRVGLWGNFVFYANIVWPATKKHKILIFPALFYLPVRYLYRVVTGKRKWIGKKFVSTAKKRKDLYEQLEIFKK